MIETFLERIVAATHDELAARMAQTPLAELQAQIGDLPAPRDLAAALRPAVGGSARLIAEIKRASPSKGLLAETFDPVAQARAYAVGGAAAISVLTEPRFFLGSLDHLRAVRAAVNIPVLRKDFVLDPYQVYETRVAGADAVLLICALLDDAMLANLLALTRTLGMEALVEAHDANEARRAVAAGASVIGVNSRNLRTFVVDTSRAHRLRPLVPVDRVFVAESGVASVADAARARAWGADAVLVGEALMRAADPGAFTYALANAPGGGSARAFAGASQPFVKICGLATPEQAQTVAQAGGDAIGLNFWPQAPTHRRVSARQACEIVAALHDTPAGQRRPLVVGLFVNEVIDRLAQIAADVGLDVIQLSGDEAPDECERVEALTGLPVVKTIRLRSATDIALLDAYALADATLLVDAPMAMGGYGGGGQTGDWALARQAVERTGWPIILAGGLTPNNVAAALASVNPRGVDVSSGVESRGEAGLAKDDARIRRFIRVAKRG